MLETRYIDVTCGAVHAAHLRRLMPLVRERILHARDKYERETRDKNYELYVAEHQRLTDEWSAYCARTRWKRFWYCVFHGGRVGKPLPVYGTPEDLQKAVQDTTRGYVHLTDKDYHMQFHMVDSWNQRIHTAQRIHDTALLCSGYLKLTSDDAFFLGQWLEADEMTSPNVDTDDIKGVLDAVLS